MPDASNLLPDLLVVAPSHGQDRWKVSDVLVFWPKSHCSQAGSAGAELLVLLVLLESLGWWC